METNAANIWVFSEKLEIALELVSAARSLGAPAGVVLTAITVGPDALSDAEALAAAGVDRLLSGSGAASRALDTGQMTALLADALSLHSPDIVLVGGTVNGTEVAARLAQRLGTPCATDCSGVLLREGQWIATRSRFGRFESELLLSATPAIVAIRPHRFEAAKVAEHSGAIECFEFELPDPEVHVLETVPRQTSGVRLDQAEVILTIGRGLKSKDALNIVESLADALGATIGATRPLTDELEWLAVDRKIGLSGQTVRPRLYVACGVSGQVEHFVGMRESDVVVAINIDPAAPIMEQSDFRIVGDLHEIVPEIIGVLRGGA